VILLSQRTAQRTRPTDANHIVRFGGRSKQKFRSRGRRIRSVSRKHTRSPEPWINSQLRANDARRAGLASPPPIAAIRCGSAICRCRTTRSATCSRRGPGIGVSAERHREDASIPNSKQNRLANASVISIPLIDPELPRPPTGAARDRNQRVIPDRPKYSHGRQPDRSIVCQS
jgi:hypothetical protein